MKSHRISRRHVVAAIAVTLCMLPSASAGAAGPTRGERADGARWTAAARYHTELERARNRAPAAIQVERPVRDGDAVFPTVLSGLALLISLAGTGYVVLRTRSRPGGVLGRSR